MSPTSWHRSRTGRAVQRLSPNTDCNSPLGRSNNPARPPRRVARTPPNPGGREITGKLRFTPFNVLLTQGLRPHICMQCITKTARNPACLCVILVHSTTANCLRFLFFWSSALDSTPRAKCFSCHRSWSACLGTSAPKSPRQAPGHLL